MNTTTTEEVIVAPASARHEADHPGELRELLVALQSVREGDFSVQLPGDWTGLYGKVADTFNDIVRSNRRLSDELSRVGQSVGKQGKTRQRLRADRRSGAWGEMESSVNTLIDDLLWPTAEVTRTIAAVAKGDLSRTMRLDVDGGPLQCEFLRSATRSEEHTSDSSHLVISY